MRISINSFHNTLHFLFFMLLGKVDMRIRAMRAVVAQPSAAWQASVAQHRHGHTAVRANPCTSAWIRIQSSVLSKFLSLTAKQHLPKIDHRDAFYKGCPSPLSFWVPGSLGSEGMQHLTHTNPECQGFWQSSCILVTAFSLQQ